MIHSFITADPRLIDQYTRNGRLDEDSKIIFTLETQAYRCLDPSLPPVKKATPALYDNVIFGPSPFQLTATRDRFYSLTTFRKYLITHMTGVDWNVRVPRSLAPDGKSKSPLTVMLIREDDLNEWSNGCSNICYPPAHKALRGSLCNGLYCSGNVRGLSPGTRYYLWVSNLEAWGPRFDGPKSSTTPFQAPFPPQKIETVIVPMDWNFPDSTSTTAPVDNMIPINDIRSRRAKI